jgi:hypothetical protein
LVEHFLNDTSNELRREISKKVATVIPGRIRSIQIYSKLMWFATEVLFECMVQNVYQFIVGQNINCDSIPACKFHSHFIFQVSNYIHSSWIYILMTCTVII